VTLDKQTPLPKGVCHHCGKPGHIRPACPERGRRSEQQASVCYNCKKDGHKIADCPKPRKECNRWPNCPNTNCSYYHPPVGDAATGSRLPARSPSRGRGARSPPRQYLPRGRSRSRGRSRDRSPRYSPPRKRDRTAAANTVLPQSIRVTGLPWWLESTELGRLFPGSDIVAGAMTDQHAAVVIFKNERERDEALQTANKMIFERL
jgi:hypothetical protein